MLRPEYCLQSPSVAQKAFPSPPMIPVGRCQVDYVGQDGWMPRLEYCFGRIHYSGLSTQTPRPAWPTWHLPTGIRDDGRRRKSWEWTYPPLAFPAFPPPSIVPDSGRKMPGWPCWLGCLDSQARVLFWTSPSLALPASRLRP
jgi:hypothetical protein